MYTFLRRVLGWSVELRLIVFSILTRQESHEHVTVSQYTDSIIICLQVSIAVLRSLSGQAYIHTAQISP